MPDRYRLIWDRRYDPKRMIMAAENYPFGCDNLSGKAHKLKGGLAP